MDDVQPLESVIKFGSHLAGLVVEIELLGELLAKLLVDNRRKLGVAGPLEEFRIHKQASDQREQESHKFVLGVQVASIEGPNEVLLPRVRGEKLDPVSC